MREGRGGGGGKTLVEIEARSSLRSSHLDRSRLPRPHHATRAGHSTLSSGIKIQFNSIHLG